jgi:hypothetical protein
VGIDPASSDAELELVTLAGIQALLGLSSDARWRTRYARAHLRYLFSSCPASAAETLIGDKEQNYFGAGLETAITETDAGIALPATRASPRGSARTYSNRCAGSRRYGPGRVSGLVFCRVICMYVIFSRGADCPADCPQVLVPFLGFTGHCGKERMGERRLSDVPIQGAIAADLVIACRG